MAQAAFRPIGARVTGVADRIDRVIGAVCGFIIMLTVIALLGVLSANVFVRYALGHGGLTWASEVPEQLFPWLIAAGIVLAVQQGAHIAVTLLLETLGRGARRCMIVVISLAVAAAYLVLMQLLLQVAAIAAAELSPILGLPRSLGYYALSFGAGLTVVSSLTGAVRVAVLGPEAAAQPNPEESVI